MYEDEKFFGPLNFKQFLYFAGGALICYFSYENLEIKFSLPIIVIVVGIFIALVLNSPTIVVNEEYLKIKKATMGPEKFERMMKRKEE